MSDHLFYLINPPTLLANILNGLAADENSERRQMMDSYVVRMTLLFDVYFLSLSLALSHSLHHDVG